MDGRSSLAMCTLVLFTVCRCPAYSYSAVLLARDIRTDTVYISLCTSLFWPHLKDKESCTFSWIFRGISQDLRWPSMASRGTAMPVGLQWETTGCHDKLHGLPSFMTLQRTYGCAHGACCGTARHDSPRQRHDTCHGNPHDVPLK